MDWGPAISVAGSSGPVEARAECHYFCGTDATFLSLPPLPRFADPWETLRVMNTQLTIEYGLETPIVSAGMAFVSGPELAAAVSNAGALGMLGAGILPPDALRALIEETRKLTGR